jgi:hypothetical protein
MTDRQSEFHRQEILKLRKLLSELEARRLQNGTNADPELWQSFMEINEMVVSHEQSLILTSYVIDDDIRHLKLQISAYLEEYLTWARSMQEMEKLFAVNVLRPGYILKQATRQRKYLEKEYSGLMSAIVEGHYPTLQSLEADIQKVLAHSDNAYQPDQRSFVDEQIEENDLWETIANFDTTDLIVGDQEDKIEQDFKRFVLPAVHPDTSDTPNETFLAVMAVYKARDYLLMEAFVNQYRPMLKIDEQQDVVAAYDKLCDEQNAAHSLSERLMRRLNALKNELSPAEIDQPEQVLQRLTQQQEEIKQLIQTETEKIFQLRENIQGLVHFYLKIKGGGDDR